MEVFVIHALKDNFVYVLRDHGVTAIADPSTAPDVLRFLAERDWRLDMIFCTHHHHDHVGGVPELRAKFDCPVYVSEYDFPRIEGATHRLHEGDQVKVGNAICEAIDIPGHTLGHWAMWFAAEKKVFVGDTLFSAGCGRLFEGSEEQMFQSLAKLKALPSETKIYFGHEYTERNLQFVREHAPMIWDEEYWSEVQSKLERSQDTTPTILSTELRVNPFLRSGTVAEFKKYRDLRNMF